MSDVEVIRSRRRRLLNALYEKTAGDANTILALADLAAGLGLTLAEAAAVGHYLEAEGWLRVVAPDGRVAITHAGVRHAEALLSGRPPDDPTRPRVPPDHPGSTFVWVENVGQAIIGPGARGIQGGATIAVDRVADFVSDVRRRQATLELDLEAWRDLKEQVATLEAQLAARRPRPGVVREALAAAKRILEAGASGAAGSVATDLARQATALLG